MAQDELFAVQEVIQSRMGDTVDIFFLPGSRLVFGSLVPKGSFVNVSLLAAGCEPPSVEEFLGNEMVKKALDFDYVRCCGCRGRAGVRAALNPFDNGFVAIGDACVSRLYKDGIGSALKTARQAAFTAIARGISRDDFRHGYQPLCRAIDRDNHYGNVLFALHQWVKNHPSFLKAQEKLVTTEQARSVTDRPYSHVIWGMFTGNDDYRHIMTMAMSPGSLGRMVSAMFKAKFGA
jgi:flavin-dependent dehydrogenase